MLPLKLIVAGQGPVNVAAGKPQVVSYSWQLKGSYSGHVTIYVVGPVTKSLNTAYFTVNCASSPK